MKLKFAPLKCFVWISGAHLSAFWGCSWALKASGFQLFTVESLFGFQVMKTGVLQEILFYIAGLLSLPFGDLLGANTLLAIVGLSLLNCCLWGALAAGGIIVLRRTTTFGISQH